MNNFLLPVCSIFSGDAVERDIYAVAASGVELGLLHLDMGNLDDAQKTLEMAK